MSTRTSRVVWDLVARDRASRTFGRVGGAATRLSRTGAGIGGALAAGFKVGTVAAGGLGFATLQASGDFEKAMNQVRAVSGATGDDFKGLRDQAKDLGATTKFSATQAAEGMGFLAMAGFEAGQIMDAMPGVLNLASAGNMDLAESADIASNVLTGYGFKAKETGRVVDVMAKTFTSTNTDLTQLGEAFKYAGPVAHSAGLKFEETSAALGLMGNAGIQASMAGTALRGTVTRLLAPTKKIKDKLDELGITVTDSTGKLLPLDDIIRQLEKSGATTGDMMTIFGQRAGPAMLALVDQGSGALVKLTKELEKSGGTAEEIADIQMEGLQGQLTSLKSAWEGLMIEIGDLGVLNLATGAVEGLTDMTRGFTGFVNEHGLPAIQMFREKFTDLVPVEKIKTGFEDAKTFIGDFFTGLMPDKGPELPVPMLKAPKAPAFMATPEVPTSDAGKLGRQIRDAVTGGIEGIDWGQVGAAVGRGLGAAVQWVAKNGAQLTKQLGEVLGGLDWVDVGKQFGKVAVPTAIGFVNSLFEPLFKAEFWKKHWLDTILAVLSAIPFGKLGGVVGKLFGKIPWGSIVAKVGGVIGKAFGKIPFGKMFPFVKKIGEAVGPAIKAAGGWVAGVARGFKNAFASRFPRVAQWFSDQLILLPVRLGDLGRLLVRKGGELVTRLGRGLIDNVPGMGNRFIRATLKVFGRFTLWQIGINLAKSLLSGIWSKMKDVGSWIKSRVVDPMVSGVKRLFGIKSPSTVFASIGRALVTGLKAGVVAVAKGIGGWAWRTFGKPQVDRFRDAGSWLIKRGKQFVGGLKDGVVTAAKGLRGWVGEKVKNPIVGRFLYAGTWLVGKGKSLISGLKDGVVEKMGGIRDWVKKKIVDPVVGAVKSFFGIKSPSTVFAGIGFNLVAGLLKGMAKTSGGAIAKKIFGDMPSALGAIVSKGLVSVSKLPGKALKALGSLGGSVLGSLGLGDSSAKGGAQQYAQTALKAFGWGPSQWPALKALWQAESGWNPLAHNASSGAHGIPQSLPASKMASEGADYWTNAATQIRWGLKYIRSRYGSPSNAWAFWQRQSPHWYDAGGMLPPGTSLVHNGTGRSEPMAVFTQQQWDTLHALAAGAGGVDVQVNFRDDRLRDLIDVQVTPKIRESEERTAFRQKVGRR